MKHFLNLYSNISVFTLHADALNYVHQKRINQTTEHTILLNMSCNPNCKYYNALL